MAKEFRLQSLLDYAEQREERKTLELAAIAAEARLARDALAMLREQQEQSVQALEGACGGVLDPVVQTQAARYLDHLAHSIGQQSLLLEEVTQRVLASRDELLEVLREKRSLERLRERREAADAIEDGRREGRAADEMTGARHARRARAEGA